jgi:DNA-binding HxlR family transcriptional regulator
MDRELLATLKALSDASRLRIVGLLAARSYAVEELAAALDLSPGTVVHHLKRLRAAGLVDARSSHPYMEYTLRLDALQRLGKQLDDLEHAGEDEGASLPGPDGEALPAYDAKVLRAFLVDGRLESIPAQEKKRDVVLHFLLDRCFVEDRDYPEKEVNQRLALFHPDVAALRRYLVEGGFMTRDRGVYRRSGVYPPPTTGSITP